MRSYQVVAFGEPLAAVDREVPQPQGTEVLLRVRAAGVCHSDLHIWDGGYDLGRGKLSLPVPLPLTMGHEIVGEVVAAGPAAHGVAPGELRLVFPWIGEGTCAHCRAGDEQLCAQPQALGALRDGGYADFVVVPHPRYLIPIGDLAPEAAAPLACSGLTTYSALKKAGDAILAGPIAVVGAGGLGLMAIRLLAAMGGQGAVVVDRDASKNDAALAAGALAVVDATQPDAAKRIATAAGEAPAVVIDLVGSTESATLAFAAVAKGGLILVVGLFGGTAPWPLPLIPLKAVTIRGNYVGALHELRELVTLVRERRVEPIPIRTRPLHEATATLDDLRHGRLVGRAVLVPEAG